MPVHLAAQYWDLETFANHISLDVPTEAIMENPQCLAPAGAVCVLQSY
jgi:hypothetical protein